MLVQVLDDIHHQIEAFALVVKVLQLKFQQQLQHQVPQPLVFFVVGVLGIGAVAGLAEIGEKLTQIPGADVDLGHHVVLRNGVHAVYLVAGVGKNIAGLEVIGAVAAFQVDLPLENVDKFDIRMVMNGVFHQVGHGDPDREVIGIKNALQQHDGTPPII